MTLKVNVDPRLRTLEAFAVFCSCAGCLSKPSAPGLPQQTITGLCPQQSVLTEGSKQALPAGSWQLG